MMENPPVKRGFACGTNAADAARKNHALGTAHQYTSRTARENGRKGGLEAARRRREAAKPPTPHDPGMCQ